jgi:hypothetical protein
MNRSRVASLLLTVALVLGAAMATAETPVRSGETANALSIRAVTVPGRFVRSVGGAASAGYGFTEAVVAGERQSHRVFGPRGEPPGDRLARARSPIRWALTGTATPGGRGRGGRSGLCSWPEPPRRICASVRKLASRFWANTFAQVQRGLARAVVARGVRADVGALALASRVGFGSIAAQNGARPNRVSLADRISLG